MKIKELHAAPGRPAVVFVFLEAKPSLKSTARWLKICEPMGQIILLGHVKSSLLAPVFKTLWKGDFRYSVVLWEQYDSNILYKCHLINLLYPYFL